MRIWGIAATLAALIGSLPAQAQALRDTALAQTDKEAEYIREPVWMKTVTIADLAPFEPARAHQAGVGGEAIVDCKAKANGSLTDCRTLKVQPTGWEFEIAGRVAAERLFRLKPLLADGRSVSGLRVIIPIVWK